MDVSSLTAVAGVTTLPVKLGLPKKDSLKHYNSGRVTFSKLQRHSYCKLQFRPSLHVLHKQQPNYSSEMRFASLACCAALNARCGAEQTQTIEKPVSVISKAPVHSKEKSPLLDDGGSGFPPRDDDGDGGGGGGGGGNYSGGFFFFGFLAFLGFLKERESEGSYQDHRED